MWSEEMREEVNNKDDSYLSNNILFQGAREARAIDGGEDYHVDRLDVNRPRPRHLPIILRGKNNWPTTEVME